MDSNEKEFNSIGNEENAEKEINENIHFIGENMNKNEELFLAKLKQKIYLIEGKEA